MNECKMKEKEKENKVVPISKDCEGPMRKSIAST